MLIRHHRYVEVSPPKILTILIFEFFQSMLTPEVVIRHLSGVLSSGHDLDVDIVVTRVCWCMVSQCLAMKKCMP